ncbi:MAG: aldo/keto reductase [Oscillospiraceae bacterium]|nr:aldo/keto reductase [Oscillospiraceae bacterium]
MEKRMLGKTGFTIAPVMFGGLVNTNESQDDADRFVSYAVGRGVNYFDVAPAYGNAEERLGVALAPYRKDVYLASKTMKRDAAGAKEDLLASMKRLRTDYFDVYQLHHVHTESDLETVFGKGGAMETLLWAQREGLVRKLGITAHREWCALKCLDLFDFDTVLYTMYWVPGVLRGLGDKLAAAAKEKGLGFLCMKVLTHRDWAEDETAPSKRQWYKPIEFGSPLALAAMKYSLSKGAASLVGPGFFAALVYMLDYIDEAVANPLSQNDMELLKAEAVKAADLEFKIEEV